VVWLGISVFSCGFVDLVRAQGQSQTEGAVPGTTSGVTNGAASETRQGSVSGKIVDPSGVAVARAQVKLTGQGETAAQEVIAGEDGQFFFANVTPGNFHVSITAAGFAAQEFSGNLRNGESYALPPITLTIAAVLTEVHVVPGSQVEVAQQQVKAQEQQRALGLIPNFYVSYVHDAAPLTSKQKFELAAKTLVDPVHFGVIGIIAGVQQTENNYSDLGQGAQGYAKRYGAAYASDATYTLIGSALLPVMLKQDPRYFYKGTGSKGSRMLYAIASAVICKGDNGRWQPNYSSVLGSLAAGGISNYYYPAKDRNGLGLTFENAFIGIAATAATNVLQEFLIRKLTPKVSNRDPGNGSKVTGPMAME